MGPKKRRDGKEGRKEGEVEEMIDARVRIEPGVDIYGPCSNLDCCSPGVVGWVGGVKKRGRGHKWLKYAL